MFICVRHGDNQRFLANTDCPVLLLLAYVRSKAGVPAGAVIDLCDQLGTPKLLFQAKLPSERASKSLPAPGPYYVCRVEFGAPGTQQEHTYQAFVPLLKEPNAALAEALRLHCERQHRLRLRTPRVPEGRRTANVEMAPAATAQAPGAAAVIGAGAAVGTPLSRCSGCRGARLGGAGGRDGTGRDGAGGTGARHGTARHGTARPHHDPVSPEHGAPPRKPVPAAAGAGSEDVQQRARAPPVPVREGAGEPGPAGGGDPADGLPPAVPRQLPQDPALPAAHGRPAALRLPPLHRHHGGRPAPLQVPGEPARAAVPARGRRSPVAARPRLHPAQAPQPQRDQQDPGPPALARHQGAHREAAENQRVELVAGGAGARGGAAGALPRARQLRVRLRLRAGRGAGRPGHAEAPLAREPVLLRGGQRERLQPGAAAHQSQAGEPRRSIRGQEGAGAAALTTAITYISEQSLDSCMELDSLRERIQRIHLETEGREETRPLQQDREEDLDGEVTGATNLACYMQDPDFGYQDFARRDEDQTQVFRVQDYSWEDHGFSLVNRLYSDIGHLLDEKFRMVDGLQSSAMAKRQGCEPSVFKRGIWNYIHCMFGIRYDDYDYAEVNHLLERMLKVYIKTVTCYPEKTNPEMFDRFWKQFKHSEKVHVNLLILEARMQAELLYALQAITQYMVS